VPRPPDQATHCTARCRDEQGLGRHRWVIERTFAWINRFRRLTIRDERRLDIHHAFTAIACSMICRNARQKRF
jgi:transposase